MALPGRSGRRSGAGFRWIAAGVVITLLVLLIDASLNSRSPGPTRTLQAGVWVDRVLPVITASTEEGLVLASTWANGLKMPASEVSSQVATIATQAAHNYSVVSQLRPPDQLGGPAGLLDAALLARSKAAAELQKAFSSTLGAAAVAPGTKATVASVPAATDPAAVLADVTVAGSDIQVGDQAYQLFLSSMPASLGVKLPSSTWGANPAPYAPQTAQVFLASLQSSAVTTPVHQVTIYGIALDPAPVSASGPVQILPDATAITVTIVLADTGNQPASNLTVTASISPAGPGSSSVRDFVNLAVGQAYTIDALGPLNPAQGSPVTMTITVTPPAGAPLPPVSRQLVFQMPAPPTTTTTVPSTGTTVPSTGTTVPATPPTT
jgi:hypothetical protein